jgi:hypothetical protein
MAPLSPVPAWAVVGLLALLAATAVRGRPGVQSWSRAPTP